MCSVRGCTPSWFAARSTPGMGPRQSFCFFSAFFSTPAGAAKTFIERLAKKKKHDTQGRFLAEPTDAPHLLRSRGASRSTRRTHISQTASWWTSCRRWVLRHSAPSSQFTWKTRCCGAARCSAWPFPQCTSSCKACPLLTSWQYLLSPGPLRLRGAAISSCGQCNAMHRSVVAGALVGVRIEQNAHRW